MSGQTTVDSAVVLAADELEAVGAIGSAIGDFVEEQQQIYKNIE